MAPERQRGQSPRSGRRPSEAPAPAPRQPAVRKPQYGPMGFYTPKPEPETGPGPDKRRKKRQ